jgi:hypothetical protein
VISYLTTHHLVAALVLCAGCIVVGAIELAVTRNRTLAALTWFFGVLVATVYTFGSAQLGVVRLWLAGLIAAVGCLGILVFVRKR